MNKFWLALLLVLLSPAPACAVDLSIKDPIVNNLEITVVASLSASCNYYLQGVIRSQSSSKYFGETANNKNDYIDYISSPEKEYITSNFFVTDVKDASWSGMVKLRFKIDDTNYLGPGLYDLKLRRFTGASSNSAGESNTLTINLLADIPTPSPTSTPTPSPSPSQSPSPSPNPSPTKTPTPSVVLKVEIGSPPPGGTVAGEMTEIDLSGFGVTPTPLEEPTLQGVSLPAQAGSQVPTLNQSRAKTVILLGIGLILISLSSFLGYRRYLALMRLPFGTMR